MIFLHIVDDYYLQGVLAKMKQRSWWERNAPKPMYRYDYIIALFEHAFSWSFMIMLPAAGYMFFCTGKFRWVMYLFMVVYNVLIHAWVDWLKCNAMRINLVQDQITHLIQVFMTWLVLVI